MSRKRTRSGISYEPPSKRKPEPKIKSMALLIDAHGDISVKLKDSDELEEFNDLVSHRVRQEHDAENYTITETETPETETRKKELNEEIEGRVTYKRNDIELTPYLWTANVINVPENVNFYAVNVPCAVGYRTPNRTNPYCWKGVCREGEETFIEWRDNLTNDNLMNEMQRLWEHYNLGISSQQTNEHFQRSIHENSIRQNPSVLPLPRIEKIIQKGFQSQSSDVHKSNILSKIQLQIFTEEGKTTYYLLNIFDATNVDDFHQLQVDYPKCDKNVHKYISKIQHYKTTSGVDLLNTTLSQILELLFSLAEKYGDNTDIYMVDHSCFDLEFPHSAEGQVKKDIYAKLTQYFTNRSVQLYMGGKETKGRKRTKRKRRRF